MTDYKYDIALSFAGEERPYVSQVAACLTRAGVSVFYDEYELVTLWGKDLYEHLSGVYGKEARYALIFASENYASKVWTTLERKSAQERALNEKREYILPARFDDTPIPGILSTTFYIDLRHTTPEQLADLVIQKVGKGKKGAGKLGATGTADGKAIAALLARVQDKKLPLSRLLADCLPLAHAIGDKDFETFCERELVGYPLLGPEAMDVMKHRSLTTYCTVGEINPQYIGWGGNSSAIFAYIRARPNEFVEKLDHVSMPVASLERKAALAQPQGYIHSVRRLADVNPAADKPEFPIHCYSEWDGFSHVLDGIRAELVRHVIRLLRS